MHKLISIIFIWIFLNVEICEAQKHQHLDSLLASLKNSTQKSRPSILNGISAYYFKESPAQAKDYAIKAIESAQKINNRTEEAEAFFNLAKAQQVMGEGEDMINSLSEAEKKYETLGAYDRSAEIYHFHGRFFLQIGKYDKSILYFDKALFKNQKGENKQFLSTICISRGSANFHLLEYKLALEDFNLALTNSEKYEDNLAKANALSNIGKVFQRLSNYDKALSNYDQALKLYLLINDKVGASQAYSNIGNIYKAIEDIKRSLEYYKKSLDIAKNSNDRVSLAMAYENIGGCYLNLQKAKEATEYYNIAEKLYKELGMTSESASVYNNLGVLYFKLSKYDLAIDNINKAIVSFTELNDKFGLASCYNNMADIYLTMKNYNTAEQFLKKTEPIIDIVNSKDLYKDHTLIYSKYCEALEKYALSLHYYKEYSKASELISYEENTKQLAEIRGVHEIDQKEVEIQNLRFQKDHDTDIISKQKQVLITFVVTLIVFIAAGVFIYFLFQQKKRINSELRLKSSELSILNDELIMKNLQITEKKNDLNKALIELQKSELKFRRLIETNSAGIFIYNTEKLLYFNPYCATILGYSAENLRNKAVDFFIHPDHKYKIRTRIIEHLEGTGAVDRFEMKIITKNQDERWIDFSTVPIEYEGKSAALATFYDITDQRFALYKLKDAKKEIEDKNDFILSSIQYAEKIQNAILPPEEILHKIFPKHFIFYKPRDIVSGDFYWVTQKDNKSIIAAVDCTGHGVPGAMMSMLGIAFLNEIVSKLEEVKANEILNQLRMHIIHALHQTEDKLEGKDGMDMSLCVIDYANMKLQYAGANNPIYIVRDEEMIVLPADKMPIGISGDLRPFVNTQMSLLTDDIIYMFTDGFADQFGGNEDRKFLIKNFKQMLLDISGQSLERQKFLVEKRLIEWQGFNEQIDDIMLIGLKV